jgi:hypothetical protein
VSLALTRNPAQFQRPFSDATTAAQSISNNAQTVANFTFAAEVDNGLSTTGTALYSSGDDRIYLRRPGAWLISATTVWASNATGYRVVTIQVDGVLKAQNVNNTAGALVMAQTVETLYYSTGGSTYATALVYQNSGGALSTTTDFHAVWLGALS